METPNEPTPALPQQGIALRIALLGLSVVVLGALALEYALPTPPEAQSAAAAEATSEFSGIALEADAAIVVDIASGRTLYERSADAQLPLASLTKVALVLAISEVLNPDDVITIPRSVPPTGNGRGVKKGESWKVADFIDYTLVASSNEGAEILADVADSGLRARYSEAPAGEAAIWRMNDLGQDLGLGVTYFLNPSGLDISPTQSGAYGSARDMAKLFAYAASAEPSLFAGTAENGLLLSSAEGEETSAENTNESQGAILGLILGKTGFTDLAGGNLTVVFDVGLARPVVAVVLASSREGRFEDMQKLVAAARATIAAR
ncbi:MAG: D-alanyl-D-alanine carboxypeptidase [Candidatus Kaiserbacteria bacterium]|nr:MAG: D-alanyl-D-alanine carboxypeptidase [Candidatus Kaiserbacteria bacterium]